MNDQDKKCAEMNTLPNETINDVFDNNTKTWTNYKINGDTSVKCDTCIKRETSNNTYFFNRQSYLDSRGKSLRTHNTISSYDDTSTTNEYELQAGKKCSSSSFKFFKGVGCPICSNSGYRGRTVIEEVMVMGRKIRDLVQSGASADEIRDAAMATGMTTLGISGLRKIEAGITTIDEVLQAVQEKEELTTICPHCEKEVNLDFRDCPYCNKTMVPICQSCQRIVQPDWVICPYCRQDLTGEG